MRLRPQTTPSQGSSEQRRLRSSCSSRQDARGQARRQAHQSSRRVKQLLADGFQPIVFCRFIDTAEYVGEQLEKALRGTTVAVVTGTLPPEERTARIDELGEVEGNRVLVATDCLSEGVNLQEQFQAVVHYDLAWNPTRHEQREGRVDRFGQKAKKVRAVTIFGSDNQIDGLVLDVLLRKHEAIRKATGVSVPVPDSNQAVVEALMEGLLLRGHDSVQESLRSWSRRQDRRAGPRVGERRGARAAVADEVRPARDPPRRGCAQSWRRCVPASAPAPTSRRSSSPSLRAFGATVQAHRRWLHGDSGHPAGRTARRDATRSPGPAALPRDFPVGRREAVLHRTDQSTAAIAGYVLEAALDPTLPPELRPARRCAVVRTSAVSTRTTLLLVRYRFHLTLPSRSGERTAVAEDAALLAFEGGTSDPTWLDGDDVRRLLDARASGNVPAAQARELHLPCA